MVAGFGGKCREEQRVNENHWNTQQKKKASVWGKKATENVENGDVQWRNGRTTDKNVGRKGRRPSDGRDRENTAKDGKLGNVVPEDG